MADSILTPGCKIPEESPLQPIAENKFLETDKFLNEYDTEEKKSVVRQNLNIPSSDSVYNKQEVDDKLSKEIKSAIDGYLNMDDPHGVLPTVREMIDGMVKSDGTIPFVQPQVGVEPKQDNHLSTKKYVDNKVRTHELAEDPHGTLNEVNNILTKYVRWQDAYRKNDLYTRQDVDVLLKDYVKRDGTTAFSKAQVGVDPKIDSHLATKRYVDKTMYSHLIDVDPHNFISVLNSRLAAYIKRKEVYDKTQTYSRTQIDSMIHGNVEEAIDAAIQDYVNECNEKYEYIRKQNYVKSDGSVPFTKPQVGVFATKGNELVTLLQLELAKKEAIDHQPIWLTSGPVRTTVGFVEDNTELPVRITFQEIMDAIFYGQSATIEVPPTTNVGDKADVLLCIHGTTGTVSTALLYQGDEVIATFDKDDFVNGCVTVQSKEIYKDTTFTFEVNYETGSQHRASATTKVSLPIFIGLLTKWKFANYVTMEYLDQLIAQDPENNKKYSFDKTLQEIVHQYNFEYDGELKHPFIVVPSEYPDLYTLTTDSQQFRLDAFDIIDLIPLQLPGGDRTYKMYVYKQALAYMDQKVTYKFAEE